MSELDDFSDEAEAAAFYASLPSTRGASGAVIRSEQGGVMLVRRAYGARNWGVPGGIMEAGESPVAACRRELHEELGVHARILGPAVVDWVPARHPRTAALQWLFHTDPPDGSEIRLQAEELTEWAWVDPDDLHALLPAPTARRMAAALETAPGCGPAYLEDGRAVFG
ncbi:NUDIX domain-containing protein [Nocardiopsis salina]|uniref:NUDIX domain-containing protein n=1 Tax=Nocardiopsis salina TaxID=245836 RepID=UPI000345F106|nr:NUDIX hydrolase [Nocardiopsis salina]